jgi:hypothetical protein
MCFLGNTVLASGDGICAIAAVNHCAIAKIDILEKIFSCLNCTSIIYSLKICTAIEQRLNK